MLEGKKGANIKEWIIILVADKTRNSQISCYSPYSTLYREPSVFDLPIVMQ